jgi:quinol monooxygenase YgiN
VTIAPWFRIKPNCQDEFKRICADMVKQTESETGCHYYGFAFSGDLAFCREAYKNAAAALEHVGRINALLGQMLAISSIEKFELIGPKSELDQLREPMAALNPVFFELEFGFGVRACQ